MLLSIFINFDIIYLLKIVAYATVVCATIITNSLEKVKYIFNILWNKASAIRIIRNLLQYITNAETYPIGIAGRGLFFMLPQFKPVLALTIIAGVAFGDEVGFLVGAMTMLTSNMIFGQGSWTPWQMFAMGIIGFLAGVLFKKG